LRLTDDDMLLFSGFWKRKHRCLARSSRNSRTQIYKNGMNTYTYVKAFPEAWWMQIFCEAMRLNRTKVNHYTGTRLWWFDVEDGRRSAGSHEEGSEGRCLILCKAVCLNWTEVKSLHLDQPRVLAAHAATVNGPLTGTTVHLSTSAILMSVVWKSPLRSNTEEYEGIRTLRLIFNWPWFPKQQLWPSFHCVPGHQILALRFCNFPLNFW
jgi:hypothetical protein